MDKSKFKAPSSDSLKNAYANRGKYPDSNNKKFIFTSAGNALLWKVADTSHKVRLLPTHPDDNINFYGMTVHIHTNVGVNGDQYLCLKRMVNTACPICEHQASLWETEPDMAKDLYPQTRYLVWVVDLGVSKDKQRVQIWSCPRTAMDDILGVSYKKSTDEIINLADLDDGIALYFDREKTQGTTFSKYKNFQLDEKSTPVEEGLVDQILPFTEVIEYATYNEIKNVFLGLNETVSPKTDVSPNSETTKKSETGHANDFSETSEKKEVAEEKKDFIDDMSRDQLEELALEVLSDDYEESEMKEMGTKKLRRLIKETTENKLNIPFSVKEEVKEDVAVDPREVLKQKLRDRIK